MHIYLILALIAAVGGGTSIVAENAVPGDILYPVKVDINENFRGGFAIGAESEAAWSVRKAERRLEEAEKISADVNADASVKAEAKASFEAQADEAMAMIAKVRAEGSAEAAASLNAALKASLESRIGAFAETEGNRAILDILRMKIDAAANTQTSVGVTAGTEMSANGQLTAAENKIAEARKFVSLKATAGTQAATDANARLEAAAALIVQGKARLEADAWADATLLFRQAFDAAQEAQLNLNGVVNVNTETKTDASVKTGGLLDVKADGALKTGIGY